MAKTYDQLQQEIAKLQRAADALKAKELSEVIGRIKLAIDHYGLTPDDLFGPSAPKTIKPTAAPKTRKAGTVTAPQKTARKAAKKPPSPPKYGDDAGNTWTGNGKRPRWFLAALSSGKTAQDLEIRAATP